MSNGISDSVRFKPLLNKVKPPADASDFLKEIRWSEFDKELLFFKRSFFCRKTNIDLII
jgi:hypothetical protein